MVSAFLFVVGLLRFVLVCSSDLKVKSFNETEVKTSSLQTNAFPHESYNKFASSLPSIPYVNVDLSSVTPSPQFYLQMNGQSSTQFGASIANIGDFNKDGYADFGIISMLGGTVSGYNGMATIVFGKAGGLNPGTYNAQTLVTGSAGFRVSGMSLSTISYPTIAAAGDFNKDGYDDFVIGSPISYITGRLSSGMVFVIFGKASGFADIDLSTLITGSTGLRIIGAKFGALTGFCVAPAGDVNKDGYADIIFTAEAGPLALSYTFGVAFVLFGKASFSADIDLLAFTTGAAGLMILGPADGYLSSGYGGGSVSGAGDFNNDGYADIIVGARGIDVVYVIYGRATYTANIDLAAGLASGAGFRITGFGSVTANPVMPAGDHNGDGIADIVIGCPTCTNANGAYAGNVYVFHGLQGGYSSDITASSAAKTFLGSYMNSNFGDVIALAGDVNGDGVNDIVIGSTGNTAGSDTSYGNVPLIGTAHVLLGGGAAFAGSTYDISTFVSGSDVGFEILSADEGDFYAMCLAAGDINGDGLSDILIGSSKLNNMVGILGTPAAPPAATSPVPSQIPSAIPSTVPSAIPSVIPSAVPSVATPSALPSATPSVLPSTVPSIIPSAVPSATPSEIPSAVPSIIPSAVPSATPSAAPSAPSVLPSATPSAVPSTIPSAIPSAVPSATPSTVPSVTPSAIPSAIPSVTPSAMPSAVPSATPSAVPSTIPSAMPSAVPSATPSAVPSATPSELPSAVPSIIPSAVPSATPSAAPSAPSALPSAVPSAVPSATPSAVPSAVPSVTPSAVPSIVPSALPTVDPTAVPSAVPSVIPSASPTAVPSVSPSAAPSAVPSGAPTPAPTPTPPTPRPSTAPSLKPTVQPTYTAGVPTSSPVPTAGPSARPTASPSVVNTAAPSMDPAAPVLTVTLTSKTRSTVTVTATFSATAYSGTVYCAAFPDGATVTTSQVITSGTSVAYLSASTTVTVTIPGLQAVVDYDTYCVASTVNGIVSLAASLSSTKLDVQTSCCNLLTYTASPSYVYGALSKYSPSAPPVFTYALSAAPRTKLTVTPVVRNATSNEIISSAVVAVQPASSDFTVGGGLVGQFFLSGTALLKGTFRVVLELSSTNAGDYSSGVATNTTVLSSATKAPAPALLRAKFVNSGASIVVTFDSATDRGSISTQTFACSSLLDFIGVSATTCSWTSASTVSIVFDAVTYGTQQLDVGGVVTLKASLVKAACIAPADCTYYNFAVQQSTVVLTADSPVVPKVLVRVPALISGCDDFSIDPTLSSGSGGRAWKAVSWVATQDTSAGSSSATDIQTVLNGYGPVTSSPIGLSKSLISSARYTVSLTLTNFFGQVSSASATFTSSDNPNLPVSSILGPSIVSIVPNDVLTLYTSTTRASCATASSKISYSWKVTKDGVLQTFPSISTSPNKFVLAPYTLSKQTVYVVTFTANSSASTIPVYPAIAASTSVTVQVGKGNIVAVVIGGSNRILAGGATDLTLDASQSYDQSYPVGSVVTGEALTYSWTCVSASTATYGISCANTLPTDKTSAKLVISAGSLTYGELYKYTVTATAADGRFNSYAVTVQNNAGSTTTSIDNVALTKVNPSKKLILTGNVQGGYALDAQWSAWIDGVSQTFTAGTPLSSSFSSAQVASTLAFPLSVPANTFTAGSVVVFRISANFAGNSAMFPSHSDVTITMNSPPTGGSIAASPNAGDALSQVFTVTSSGWTDDATDYPLTYEFTYQVNSAQPALTVQSMSVSNVVATALPPGLDSQNGAVTLISTVYDTFQASTSASVTVVVTAAADLNVTSYLSAQLANAQSTGDTSWLTQAIANAASMINTVNCGAVNSTYCAGLNRSPCYSTPQKCSACLSGYTGLSGDGNTMCRNDGAVLNGPGESCSTSDDCTHGLCVASVCTVPTLECPSTNDDVCTGHGDCQYRDSNGGSYASPCTILDLDCKARCSCVDGYGGVACSLEPIDLESYGNTRAALCSAVVSVGTSEDVSYHLLDALLGALYAAYDPNELVSATGRQSCYDALKLLTGFSGDGYLSEESTGLIIDLVSKFVEDSFFSEDEAAGLSGRRLSASNSVLVDNAISGIISGILNNMANGEDPVVYSNSHIELTVYKTLSSNFTQLAPPTSAISSHMEITESTAAALESDSQYIQASALLWLTNPFPNSTQLAASLLRVEVFGAESTSRRAQDASDTEAAFYVVSQFTTTQDFNFTLSIDQALAVHANNFTFPKCTQVVDGVYESCGGCWVSTYTNSNVTYACPLSALLGSDGARKLQSSEGQQSQFSTVVSNVSPSDQAARQGFEMNWGREKILLAFLSTLTFVICLGFIYFYLKDAKISPKGVPGPAAGLEKSSDPQYDHIYASQREIGSTKDIPVARVLVSEFLDSVFAASDLQRETDSTWSGLLYTLLQHHKYTALFFGSTRRASNSVRWTSLTMGFLLNLFFDTVFFGVFYPDNGLCQDHHNIDSCLNPNSRVTDTNLCQWLVDETTGEGKCGLNPPPRTFVFLIVIVMVVVVISVPFQAAYDYLLINVLTRRPRFEDWGFTAPQDNVSTSNDHNMLSVSTFQASEVYDGTMSVQKEADQVRQQANEFVATHQLARTDLSAKLAAIQEHVNDNLTASLTAARHTSATIVQRVSDVGNAQAKDTMLLQHFIFEQFPTFKQFVLRRHFFDLAASTQGPVHPLVWVLSLTWVVLSLAFFLAWAFAWAATHRGSAAADWGIVLGTTLAQDLLVIQVFRVWVIYVLSMESIRPQLQAIYRVLHRVAESHTQDELGGNIFELRLCQHVSPACRAAHSENLQSLSSATILRRLDDADVAACRTPSASLPATLGWLYDAVGVVVLGMLLPAFFDAFLIMNRYFYAGANLFILVPYLFAILLYVLWVLIIKPAFEQARNNNPNNHNNNNNNNNNKSKTSTDAAPETRMVLRSNSEYDASSVLDQLPAPRVDLQTTVSVSQQPSDVENDI